jgi:hypothetical protein
MTWSCTSGSLTAMYIEAYIRQNNKQLCNRLIFFFQASIVFSQSTIYIALYQAKEITGSVRFTYFICVNLTYLK